MEIYTLITANRNWEKNGSDLSKKNAELIEKNNKLIKENAELKNDRKFLQEKLDNTIF